MAVVKSPKNNKRKFKWIKLKAFKQTAQTRQLNYKIKQLNNKFKDSTLFNISPAEKYVTFKMLNKG